MKAQGLLFYGSGYYAHPSFDHGDPGEAPGEAPRDGEGGPELRALSSLDGCRPRRTEPRITGFPLDDVDGEHVGTVSDLIVDLGPRKVRYAVVDLDGLDRRTLLPIGYVRSDREKERARTPSLSAEDIRLLPAFQPPLTREAENRLHAAIEGRLSGERYFERADFRPV